MLILLNKPGWWEATNIINWIISSRALSNIRFSSDTINAGKNLLYLSNW